MKGPSLPLIAMSVFLSAGAAMAESSAHTEAAVEQKVQSTAVPSPVQLVRTLHLMQDQIAVGSTEAHIGQRGLLGILDDRFMNLAPETWQTSKNVRAAVSFVLSGGNPA